MDTECKVDIKSALKWNTLFQAFQSKEFHVLLQDDLSTKLSKGIYKTIPISRLHQVATENPVLPCLDLIQWMTWRIDHERRTILKFEDKHIASYTKLLCLINCIISKRIKSE